MMESVLAWMLRWVTRTALGRAVVPEVNIRAASRSRSTATGESSMALVPEQDLVGQHRDVGAERFRSDLCGPPVHEDRCAAQPRGVVRHRLAVGRGRERHGHVTDRQDRRGRRRPRTSSWARTRPPVRRQGGRASAAPPPVWPRSGAARRTTWRGCHRERRCHPAGRWSASTQRYSQHLLIGR